MLTYKPISKQRNEFRLVRLDCHTDTKILTLELRHVSANDQVAYHALSYVWGDPKDMQQIIVNGQAKAVSQNLIMFLREILRQKSQFWLWVDSICINQADEVEKAWQVNAMSQIYGNAAQVHLWLGSGSARTALAMELLHEYGHKIFVDLKGFKKWTKKRVTRQLHAALENKKMITEHDTPVQFLYDLYNEPRLRRHKIDRPVENYPLLDGLRDIFDRPFWRRIWIVQEITLAQDAILMCGDKSIPFKYFQEVIDIFMNFSEIFGDFDAPSFCGGLDELYYPSVTLHLASLRGNDLKPSLSDVLLGVGSTFGVRYLATDPRDLVFGVLSIVKERETFKLEADYSQSVGEVFARATKSFIDNDPPSADDDWEDTFALDELQPSSSPGLPSWAPDYEKIGKEGLELEAINYYCKASASRGAPGSQMPPAIGENPLILHRRGCVVDIVTEVMSPLPDEIWELEVVSFDDTLQMFVRIGSHVVDFVGLGTESTSQENYVWRTVTLTFEDLRSEEFSAEKDISFEVLELARLIFRGKPLEPAIVKKVIAQFESDPYSEDSESDSESSDESSERTLSDEEKLVLRFWEDMPDLNGRTLFKTAKGMLGIARDTVKPDDIVTLMWDVPSPVVLRHSGDQFLFLGDAYVDGIMKGEFFQTNPLEVVFELC